MLRMISWPSPLLACPVHSIWSQIWKRKHQDAVLIFLAIDILYYLNSKLNGKVLRIELKWCLLLAQVSSFNLVKVGYYPILHLAVIAFKVVYFLLLYFIYCVLELYIRYTNVQSCGLGAIAWPNVPWFKLSTCFLFMICGMDSHFVRQRGRF